jgi:hypothetical protein
MMNFRSNLTGKTVLTTAAVCLAFSLWQSTAVQAQTPAPTARPKAEEKTFVIEYYYRVKWGFADEFIRLFKKNHYPFLKKQIDLGTALQVTAETPVHHSTESDRWDYRITIIWKNVQVAHDDSGDEAMFKQLYPDQETFKREEQRRFEILTGHWDVPVRTVNLEEK